ncbi:MAG: hypothetical protein P4L34_07040 [Paludibacter sp.]|nr:hypothetical protein [Paludibacter sp.]
MPKEDYLLKYLEKLSRVIAAMLGLRDKGYPEDAIRLADETYKELLGFSVNELNTMPVDEFVKIIREIGYSSTYLEALAQLAFETGNSYKIQGNNEFSQGFYQKSLQLYYFLNEKDKTFSFEREMTISELKQLTINTKKLI